MAETMNKNGPMTIAATDPIETFFSVATLLQELKARLDRLEASLACDQPGTSRLTGLETAVEVNGRNLRQAEARLDIHSDQLNALLRRLDALEQRPAPAALRGQRTPESIAKMVRSRAIKHESDWTDDEWVKTTDWVNKPGAHQSVVGHRTERYALGRRLAQTYRDQGIAYSAYSDGAVRQFRVGDLRLYTQWLAEAKSLYISGAGPVPDYQGWTRYWHQHHSHDSGERTGRGGPVNDLAT